MPGFNINTGNDRTQKFNKAEFRRKHRWRVALAQKSGIEPQEWIYLQKAARPSFTLDEPVVHHDQEHAYFAGKQKWEALQLVFYDAVGGPDISSKVYQWVNNVVNINSATVALPIDYKDDLIIEVLDNQGEVDEIWTLHGAWPQNTNWNDLDYQQSEIQLINVTVRFDRAVRSQP